MELQLYFPLSDSHGQADRQTWELPLILLCYPVAMGWDSSALEHVAHLTGVESVSHPAVPAQAQLRRQLVLGFTLHGGSATCWGHRGGSGLSWALCVLKCKIKPKPPQTQKESSDDESEG